MPHTGGSNYKEKWLKELRKRGADASETIKKDLDQANVIIGTQASTAIALAELGNLARDLASLSRTVIQELDETSKIGDLEFSQVGSEIDFKLRDMDAKTMLRRARDTIRILNGRLGIITVAYEQSHDAVSKLRLRQQEVSANNELLSREYLTNLAIGVSPDEDEIEEFVRANGRKDSYVRFGTKYADLQRDWEDHILESSDEEEEDDDEIEDTGVSSLPKSDSAVVLSKPASPGRSRVDSKVIKF